MSHLLSSFIRPFKIRRLKKEYNMLFGSSGVEAEQSLRRQTIYLQEKHPGRSEDWYMEKVVYDLKRDRGLRR